MRILLDTNIFIYREDNNVISKELQTLLQILNKLGTKILVHPKSIEELKKDSNETRKAIILSKIGAYPMLESPPDPSKDEEYNTKIKIKNEHDIIDSIILYSVYKNAVDFLITEDKALHKKAYDVGIKDRVLLINDALHMFNKDVEISGLVSPPALKEDFVYNLDLNDPIFDKLKRDYPGFVERWFPKISREGRKCWVHYREDGTIGALLIYKIEDEAIEGMPPLPKKKRLKLSTFIVTNVGHKIGELFIKLSVDLCVKNGLNEMYLTHFTEENDRLVQLITEYGFQKVSTNSRGEEIYLKKLIPETDSIDNLSPIEIVSKYYPSFYDGPKIAKYIVPIRPSYHDRLFTDYLGRQTTLFEHAGEFIVEGNAIKKAYLTNSRIKTINQGDIIIFYRSKDKSELTSIGIVESVHTQLTDVDEIIKIVGKRTVYSRSEIEEISNKPTTIILFYHIGHFPNSISYSTLKEIGAISGPPQSILQIDEGAYKEIIKRSGLDERFIIH